MVGCVPVVVSLSESVDIQINFKFVVVNYLVLKIGSYLKILKVKKLVSIYVNKFYKKKTLTIHSANLPWVPILAPYLNKNQN